MEAVSEGNPDIARFDTSVFNGEYVTGDITPGYLEQLEADRNDDAKALREENGTPTVIGLQVCTISAMPPSS